MLHTKGPELESRNLIFKKGVLLSFAVSAVQRTGIRRAEGVVDLYYGRQPVLFDVFGFQY